jgi:tRNA 2-selenouridine synthase
MNIEQFLQLTDPIIDVRSPAEFAQGRIPGSFNIPLLSNEERAEVGTVYKQIGQKEAIELGHKLVEPKLDWFLSEGKRIAPNGAMGVLCWRGGMRSGWMAQFFASHGYKTTLLKHGYKAFRRWAMRVIEQPKQVKVLGGFTCSGKSDMLREMIQNGEQVLDLEAIANHRGSAFGYLGAQPSNEQFENEIAVRWARFESEKPIWIEDESRLVGNCFIPVGLYEQMQHAPLILVEKTLEERLKIVARDYYEKDPAELIASVQKIHKRLGGENTRLAIEAIERGELDNFAKIVLAYYDRAYQHSITRRPGVTLQPLIATYSK